MKTDVVIRSTGMDVLIEKLGLIEAERFIMLIQKDSFDYTKWRENLFNDLTLEELSKRAMEYRRNRLISTNKAQARTTTATTPWTSYGCFASSKTRNSLALAIIGYDNMVAIFDDSRDFRIIIPQIANSFNMSRVHGNYTSNPM